MSCPRRLIRWILVPLAGVSIGAAGPDPRLPEAARAGDMKTLDALLAAGADINSVEPDGTAAIHWAVYRDDATLTARLVAAGADVNLANRNGATPLSLACGNASAGPVIVERLLKAGEQRAE